MRPSSSAARTSSASVWREVAILRALAAVDVLGHAAREGHAVRLPVVGQLVGDQQVLRQRVGSPRIRHTSTSAIVRTSSSASSGASGWPSVSRTPAAAAACSRRPFDAHSTVPSGANATSRPPTATAAVASTSPVVHHRQLAGAAADVDVQQRAAASAATAPPRPSLAPPAAPPGGAPPRRTRTCPLPSANRSAISCALMRFSASPVRITAPLSIVRRRSRPPIGIVDEALQARRHRSCCPTDTASAGSASATASRGSPRRSGWTADPQPL